MIALVIELECDGCTKRQSLRCDGLMGVPHLPTLVAAYGWGQFLTGPILCAECCQSYPMVEKSTRIFRSALSIMEQEKDRELAERGQTETDLVLSIRASQKKVQTGGRPHKHTDEKVRAVLAVAGGNLAEAARRLGVSYNNFCIRVRNMKPVPNGEVSGNGSMDHVTQAEAPTTNQ